MIQMTREQYQQKYGTAPTQPATQPSIQPIQMTRQEYQAKYGQPPSVQTQKPSFLQNVGTDAVNIGKGILGIPKYLWEKGKQNFGKSPNEMIASVGKDLIGGTVNEYNELAGKPLEGGDFMQRAGERAYEKPVTTALDLLPAVGFLKKLGGAKNVAGASTIAKPGKFSQMADELATRGLGGRSRKITETEKIAGQTRGEFINKYPQLYERTPQAAKEVLSEVGSKFDEASKQSGRFVKAEAIITDINTKIAELKSGFRGAVSDSAKKQIEGLQTFRDRFSKSFGKKGDVSLADYADFRKTVIDPDVPENAWNLPLDQASKVGGLRSARAIGRQKTIEVAPELEGLGMDYKMAKLMEQQINDYVTRGRGRQVFNFTKLGSAGLGAFLNGLPGAIGGFFTEQLVNSPKFIQIMSNALRKLDGSPTPKLPINIDNKMLFSPALRNVNLNQTQPISPTEEKSKEQSQSYNPIVPLFDKGKKNLQAFKMGRESQGNLDEALTDRLESKGFNKFQIDNGTAYGKDLNKDEQKLLSSNLVNGVGGMTSPISSKSSKMINDIYKRVGNNMPGIGEYDELIRIATNETKIPKSVIGKLSPQELLAELKSLLSDVQDFDIPNLFSKRK